MNVSGIRPNEKIYSYNSTRLSELRNEQIAAGKELQVVNDKEKFKASLLETYEAPLNQTYSSYDYAQEYRVGASYELKGADADIAKLDVQKAISSMDKDQVLKQYQYFVGDKISLSPKTITPEVIPYYSGENFIL